jgi:hypothetical protein
MTIWLVALLIIAFYAMTGRAAGMIYSLASFFGAVGAAILAPLLGGLFEWVPPLVGLPHPIWKAVLPPIAAFLMIVIVVASIGGVAQRKVYLHFKYRDQDDDARFFRWDRMNRNLGLVLGLCTGLVYLIVVSVGIWMSGYATGQVKSEDSHGGLKFINRLYDDAQATGLGKFAAVFGPAPVEYYETADLVGLLYNNPNIYDRLAMYPNLISLRHRDDIKDLFGDTNLVSLVRGKGNIVLILTHPKVVSLIQNTELRAEYDKLDKGDLVSFLNTGESKKWKDDPLVGYWQFDAKNTEEQFLSKYNQLQMRDRVRLSHYLKVVAFGMTLSFGTDNQAFFEGRLVPTGMSFKLEAQRRVKEGEVVNVTNLVLTLPPLTTNILALPPRMLAKGTWKKEGEKLSIEIAAPGAVITPPPVVIPRVPGTPPPVARPPIVLPPLKIASDLQPVGGNKLSVQFGSETFIFERIKD